MEWDFVDFPTKAKELGITEGTLKARVLSGSLPCFIHLANVSAVAESGEWLPPWTRDHFPMIWWKDFGAPWEKPDPFGWGNQATERQRHHYLLNGWAALDSSASGAVLTRGYDVLDRAFVHVVDEEEREACCLSLRVPPLQEWENDNGTGVGYWRDVSIALRPADLFMPAADPRASDGAEKPLDPRERATLLCIIRALAKEANFDLSQPYKAGDALAAALKRNCDIQLSSRTIGQHLKRAIAELGTQPGSHPSK